MDARVRDTYVKDSKATLRTALYDPYVKAIRWALDRIGDEGVVAFVTNNSFLDGMAFDGMRKHVAEDCAAIYILDLGGNARKGLKVLRCECVRDSRRCEYQPIRQEKA